MNVTVCLTTSLVLATFAFSGRSAQASEPQVDSAIRKSLPYLEAEGVAWIEKRGCVSCHQVPAMLWSLSAASQAGFEVDADRLAEWQRWSTDVINFVQPAQKADVDVAKTLAANIDTMSALLLAIDDDSDDAWRHEFADALTENQNDDGSWQACGQLPAQKRPAPETTRVTVAWTLLALGSTGRTAADFDSAIAWVDRGEPAQSTEWWVTRLLLAHERVEPAAGEYRQGLLDRQKEDGGWGWLSTDPSDALATGMALYALGVTRTDSDDESVIRRASEFLISTQQSDGSWQVPGTKKSTRNKSTPTSNYWGTGWAVIGLLETRE